MQAMKIYTIIGGVKSQYYVRLWHRGSQCAACSLPQYQAQYSRAGYNSFLPMKIYTIIRGVNSVGKSSFTGVLKSQTTDLGTVVDVDKITAQLGGKPLDGGRRALQIMESCIRDGVKRQ